MVVNLFVLFCPLFSHIFCCPVKEAQRIHDETGPMPSGHVINSLAGHMTPPGPPATGVFQIRPGPKDESEEDLGMAIT
jgi:hypothetical protein